MTPPEVAGILDRGEGRQVEFKEGVAAFLAKRPAQFTGR